MASNSQHRWPTLWIASCFMLIMVGKGRAAAVHRDHDSLRTVMESLTEKLTSLETRLQALENVHSAVVSFFVQFSDYHHPINQDNTRLQFDDVKTNVGGAYHPELGQFIAPVAGTYAFFLDLLSDHAYANWMNFLIHVNGNEVALTQLTDTATLSVVLELKAGDKVNAVKRDGPGKSIYGINHSTFSGMLVRQS